MFERLDFDEFHRERLPALLARRPEVGRPGPPISFRLPDGRAYTLVAVGTTVTVTPGDDGAATVVALAPGDWSDFVHERHTSFGLLYAGALTFPRGDFEGLERWEPTLRSIFHGRPIYDPGDVAALPLHRSFTLDEDPDDLAAFLRQTGFLHVQGGFSTEEISAVSAEVERLRARARPDDRRSWWARTAEGHDVCCRLIYTSLESALLDRLAGDERLHQFAALSGEVLVPAVDRLDGVTVVIKNPGVVEGLSDLPWHRDCGLGGHPVLCPSLNIGIQLDRADAAHGQLHFLAGSHRSSGSPPATGEALPTVAIETEPGDVTVHFGHVFHAAPPPTGLDPGRRALYVGFVPASLFDVVGVRQGYNDVLFTGGSGGHVASVEERLERTTAPA